MSFHRILVAVDDSAPAFAAARTAIQLAADCGASLRFVAVSESRHPGASDSALAHAASLCLEFGVPSTTATVDGQPPFERLLAEAQSWTADLIVMGRSDVRGPGAPRVGSQTEHLLEFTTIPVLVVPSKRTS